MIDFYKFTMLQLVHKHYADLPVTWSLHSRNQSLAYLLDDQMQQSLRNLRLPQMDPALAAALAMHTVDGKRTFSPDFLNDLQLMLDNPAPLEVTAEGVQVSGTWFETSLWETAVLSTVSEVYSRRFVTIPNIMDAMNAAKAFEVAGVRWSDFGTRRRYSRKSHEWILFAVENSNGFMGTSNVEFAISHGIPMIGTYAHELEMVLRNYYGSELEATHNVMAKWSDMYPRPLRIALTDTYGTSKFLKQHGQKLIDQDWRGIRLDSGNPFVQGTLVEEWCERNNHPLDVVFSDSLDRDLILGLQHRFGDSLWVNPIYGWGTGLTNPNSDLSLVMKAVESCGKPTYKITDDVAKSIR